jgi:2-polyprenyl-6-methoxyphenol hydroxylase-like FAD-dependent oxidoreductase
MERRSFGDAVVIGGSMAGLLAARVLSDYFRTVTIVERDEPGTPSQARRGVPQGHHAHGLLLRGQDTICRLFSSMREQLLAAGARSVNMGRDVKWYHFDVWKCRYHSALDFISASRPLIEWTVAERVRRLPNVKMLHGWSVESVIYDGHSISGIRMHRRDDRDVEQRLNADLVIDASGRGSQIPQQLRVLGFERPEESSVRIDVGYASCLFRAPRTARDWKALYVVSQPPAKRGALILPLEGDRWICTLVGMHGDHPPTDYAGYMAFAKSLPVPDMYEALRSAEPLGEIVRYGFSAGLRRHYEKLNRFPPGLLVLGDALCSFNPIYGQGMTCAAQEAEALGTALDRHGSASAAMARDYYRAAAEVIVTPWRFAVGGDFGYPQTTGPRPRGVRLNNWYARRIALASQVDTGINAVFQSVQHLVTPPSVLMRPRFAIRVMRAARRRLSAARR